VTYYLAGNEMKCADIMSQSENVAMKKAEVYEGVKEIH
jgi:hypothetical protein